MPMPNLKLDLDPETYHRLIEVAVSERRPIVWQAEVLPRRSLGLAFPYPDDGQETLDPNRVPAHASR
jgi:hypothetical protein